MEKNIGLSVVALFFSFFSGKVKNMKKKKKWKRDGDPFEMLVRALNNVGTDGWAKLSKY